MGFVAQNRVADIVVMRHLHIIKKDHILELRRVADDAVGSDERLTADKRAGTHLRAGPNDGGTCNAGIGINLGRLRDPDVLRRTIILLLRKRFAKLKDEVSNPGERLPGVFPLAQQRSRLRMRKVIEIDNLCFFHKTIPPDAANFLLQCEKETVPDN